jgi:hypothetical protein
MENYMWSAIGVAMFAFFVRVYWDVLTAYLAYRRRNAAVTAAPGVRVGASVYSVLHWVGAKADRMLHALLMSPTPR